MRETERDPLPMIRDLGERLVPSPGLVAPLYSAALYDKPLRFFRAPFASMHLPWHAFDDLPLCLDLAEGVRADLRRRLMSDWAADVRTIATAAGVVTIAPNWIATGLVAAIEETRGTGPALTIAYQQQLFSAWAVLTGDMPAAASMELLSVAVCNSLAQQGRSP